MNINDGHIRPWVEIEKLPVMERQNYRPMAKPPTPKQELRRRVSRNDPCPCGSGSKFKKCCLRDSKDSRFT